MDLESEGFGMKRIIVQSADHVQWSMLVYSTITFYSSLYPLTTYSLPSSLLFSHYWDLVHACIGWVEGEEERKGEGGEGRGGRGRGREVRGEGGEGRGRGRGRGKGREREGKGKSRGEVGQHSTSVHMFCVAATCQTRSVSTGGFAARVPLALLEQLLACTPSLSISVL